MAMASPSSSDLHLHLRRLKQALTCSLCLRLMQQPACLGCNHHFCVSCLLDSLTAMAACPRCKQPGTTRHVKLSPDVVNIVSVYQSLKIAAGHKSGLLQMHDSGNTNTHDQNPILREKFRAMKDPACEEGDLSSEQMMHISKESVSSILVDATEVHKKRKRMASSVVELPCRGNLTTSKRVQLPCPLSGIADELHKVKEEALEGTPLESMLKCAEVDINGYENDTAKASPAFHEVLSVKCFSKAHEEAVRIDQTPQFVEDKGSLQTVEGGDVPCQRDDLHSSQPLEASALSPPCPPVQPTTELKEEIKLESINLDEHMQVGKKVSLESTGMMQSDASNSLEMKGVSARHAVDPKFGDAQGLNHGSERDICKSETAGSSHSQVVCAFCLTSDDSQVAGPMIHYNKGVPVKGGRRGANHVSVHKFCAEWAPNVYYEDDVAKNLPQEIARGQKIKCSGCGLKGAVLGCCVKRCRKSYHYPCARALLCRWDEGNFLVLCPEHVSSKFPNESAKRRKTGNEVEQEAQPSETGMTFKEVDLKVNADILAPYIPSLPTVESCSEMSMGQLTFSGASKWVICGSGLDSKASALLVSFISCTGARFCKNWSPCVTHLITGTDETGAARRTFKYLMATLEGKWILKADWLAAVIAAGQLVNEELYEIDKDIHGMVGGPKHGRFMAVSKNQPLFEGLKFYFMGTYAAAYKADLQALITTAGGDLLNARPDAQMEGVGSSCVIVYNKDFSSDVKVGNWEEMIKGRRLEAKCMASSVAAGAKVVGHTWILDSIAAYALQLFE